MKRIPSALAVWLAVLLPNPSAHALNVRAHSDYQGAKTVLKQLVVSPEPSPQTGTTDPVQWFEDWTEFRARSAGLSPETAARQWLDLADGYSGLSSRDFNALLQAHRDFSFGPRGMRNLLILALPGPAAWPALAKMISARPAQSTPRKAAFEEALHLLAATLVADSTGQGKAVQAMLKIQEPRFSTIQGREIALLEDALAEQSDDAVGIAAAFEAKIAAQKKRTEAAATANGIIRNSFGLNRFMVPDLVTLLGGEKKTEPLLREAILLPDVELEVSGVETNRLAAKLALKLAATAPAPHWELACSLEGAPLYEALQARFPQTSSGSNYKFNEARGYYLLHLIVDGQRARAVELAESPEMNATSPLFPLDALERAGYPRQAGDFLHDLLAKNPGLPFWSDYIRLAAKTGRTSEMLALIRSVTGRTDLTNAQRGSARESFYLALLAADQIDEGVAELRKVIADGQTPGQSGSTGDTLKKEIALARLGQLLERQNLVEEGISAAKKSILKSDFYSDFEAVSVASLAELLVQLGRGPEAEEMLGNVLKSLAADNRPGSDRAACLAALMRVYYLAGRPDDVILVLERFPGWGAEDLSAVLTQETTGYSLAEYSTHAAADTYPVGYMAAWALAQRGEKAEALKIANALLDQEGGFDPAYELMTRLAGHDNAMARLDQIAKQDAFEERPLIWKARLELGAGQLGDAEKTIQAAIGIDPSDGEEGPGRRMLAYSVFADIREKIGDQEHAQIYRGAVAAIRISEHADRFYEAGLLTRAVGMYKDALTHFADAYCIQSRLALRLSELGDNAGAEEHYRRAYELMPSSFGRVESHCFGCERAFAGNKAQGIAEQVFTQLAAKMPEKPQVHYLLGYLRMAQSREREALPEFQEAVKLDPDYLNAWKEIGYVGERMHLPAKLQNDVILNEIRLDPLARHGTPDTENVSDLAGLWNALGAAKDLAPPPPGPLFPLTASALEQAAELGGAAGRGGRAVAVLLRQRNRSAGEPIDAIAQNRFVAAVGTILTALPQFSEE